MGNVFVYLTDEVGLVLNSSWDLQPAHGIEELIRAHGLGHASLLEELRTDSHLHLGTGDPRPTAHTPGDQSSRYRGNIPAIPEEELQTVRMSGLHGLTDIDQPDLPHNRSRVSRVCLPLAGAAVAAPHRHRLGTSTSRVLES